MTDIRDHPDYAEGYEARWYRKRPKSSPSPEYEAGYNGAGKVGEMFRELGYVQDAAGLWVKPREVA
jgi:hypothetical protein